MLKITTKYVFLYLFGGGLYYTIECLWRGYSHWSMFILGGICFLFCGIQNEIVEWSYPLLKQVIISDLFVICSEFLTGCIVNLGFNWNVWDYSNLSLNILGQVCPQFALLFFPLCLFAIVLDDYIRYFFFSEEKPKYVLWR